MMFLRDGQGMAVFVAGGEEGGSWLSLHSPQPFFVGLCTLQADEVEELHRGFGMDEGCPGFQIQKIRTCPYEPNKEISGEGSIPGCAGDISTKFISIGPLFLLSF